jgi:exosome complex RNA-binding protein Rrp42 (RNase PH superfamily)
MLTNYSENEKIFFKKILLDYDIRIDGRDKLEIRDYQITKDIIPSCLSSIKISYNNYQKDILLTIKGEITDNINDKLLNISIDSMYKQDDINNKIKKEIENYIDILILSKIDKSNFNINNSNQYYWKLYIDIFIFDYLQLSLLQLISIGIKELLYNIRLPKLILFKNNITNNIEYDIIETYEDISEQDKIYLLDRLQISDIYIFAIINNSLYLDPIEEETSICNCLIIVSSNNTIINSIQSVGTSIDIQQMFDISSIIKSIKRIE